MKLTKRLSAIVLSLLMAVSMPLVAFAEGADANFTLTQENTRLYAGMSYEITASISDVTAQQAATITSFTWDITSRNKGASISSKNNFISKNNGNNTYTVTETATFIMPQAGTTAQITASFGSRSKSMNVTSLQPIESYSFNFVNSDHAYYDENSNTLYLDRLSSSKSTEEFAEFYVSDITPAANDDSINVGLGGFSSSNAVVEVMGINSYKLTLQSNASGKGTLGFSTESGKTPMTLGLQTCIPFTKYDLSYTAYGETTALKFASVSDEEDAQAALNVTAGKPFSISASPSPSAGNDQLKYTLYTDRGLTSKASSTYYTTTGNNCELSIGVAGTYYLVCKNYSMDVGMLKRDLGKIVISITVSQAYPIQNINLYKLENGTITDEVLEEITLYTNTDTTYPLENNVVVAPDKTLNTDKIIYSSSDPKVAKVDENTGLITALAKGNATIWIRSRDNAEAIASLFVNVKIGVKSITSIATSNNAISIPSGHVNRLVATTNPEEVDEPIYWSTSNPNILSVNPTTGVVTAKEVSQKTPVIVYATTESGVSTNTPINVVPAIRATSLDLSVTSTSETFKEEKDSSYKTYTDYYQSKNGKEFTVTAVAPGENGAETNDEFVWTVTYNSGVGMTFEEAKDAGYLTYTKNSESSYTIVPLKTEPYAINCTATTNVTNTSSSDPTDTVIIKLRQTATTMSVIDESTGKTAASTIYLPIGKSAVITVKTSTAGNSKTEDPAVCTVLSGGEYVSITEEASKDNEGKTFTITGLSYGMEATKIKLASASGSKSTTITFYVRNSLADAEISGVSPTAEYTGKAITFSDIKLYSAGTSIDSSLYSIKYSDNVNVGTATITITGTTGADKIYSGSVKIVNFSIIPKSLSSTATVAEIADQKLSAKVRAVTPNPSVKIDGKTLKNNQDYTLSYSGNTAAGTGTVTITGIGNYTGSIKKTFKVIDVADYFSIASIPTKTYIGKAIAPAPVVTYRGKTLKNGVDYTLSYANNTSVGTATVTVKGLGYYTGTKAATFTIKPKTGNITSLKADKKAFTVKWSKQTDITAYQIQYATDSKFTKNKKTVTITNIKSNSKKISKLSSKKKYYVRVRAYKTVSGKKIYGSWSKVKNIKTK